VDSVDLFTSVFITACRENGFDRLTSRDELLALFDGNFYETMRDSGLDNTRIDKILSTYETKMEEHVDEVALFAGMGEVLEKVCQDNTVYIVTSNVSHLVARVLTRNGLTGFKDVLGAEKDKNKVRKIQGVMRQHPHLPAFFVGDTKGDIIEGKEAGACTIGAAWGWHGALKLKECLPDYLVLSPRELADLFSRQGRD
ncbi:MAG: HAD family hydrolase, partial [Eubacteriales bacterium]